MRLLDLYSGAGGAAMGYHHAGFTHIVGVDNQPQPRYPFHFIQADALDFLRTYGHAFDAVHASPPCQTYSRTSNVGVTGYPDLIGPTRDLLTHMGIPIWVIENVPDAPLHDPIILCGQTFGLTTYRHRLFEIHGFQAHSPTHQPHTTPVAKMGRAPQPGEFMHVVGNYIGADAARTAMGINWMRRAELSEAIPPAYTTYLGERMIDTLAFHAAFGAVHEAA